MSAFRRISVWYEKLAAFNVESLFSRKPVAGPPRTVFVNQPLPEDYYDKKHRVKKEHVYSSNQVITSKYTIITFIPRNLLEQFRRVANVFFLAIAILQFFHIFSTVSPGLVILPLIVVLAITALKDGYEDIKRHQSDRAVNYSMTRVLAGGPMENPNAMERKSKTFVKGFVPKFKRSSKKKRGAANEIEALQQGAPLEGIPTDSHYPPPSPTEEENIEYDDDAPVEGPGHHHHLFHHDSYSGRPHWKLTTWEDVRVGDVVKIMDNESIPADILICATSEEEDVAFIETKNLDGETNLKSRTANPSLTHLRKARDCADPENVFTVDCDRPDTNLYKLNAAVVHGDQKSPVDIQQMMLRGTVLRNTSWVIGVVLFTGQDTKIVMNSGDTPSKRSKVERQMNPQVFINLFLLATMAVVLGIVDAVLEQRDYPKGAPWLYGDTQSDDNTHINGLVTWAFALITFQNIVPISLYISIEAVRTLQALWIYFDREIYYAKTDQPTLARSWNLSDDLGQIQYIFSDKTGTLTQNAMIFRQCSIAGKAYRGDPEGESSSEDEVLKTSFVEDASSDEVVDIRLSKASSRSAGSGSTSEGSIKGHGAQLASGSDPHNHGQDLHLTPHLGNTTPASPLPSKESSTDKLSTSKKPADAKKSDASLPHFKDSDLRADLVAAKAAYESSDSSPFAKPLNGFWSALALCHTVLTSVDPETDAIEYKAQSPDEAALVRAAADVGFVFRGREREVLTLTTPFSEGRVERWELLNVLEFNSARKRMSVVIRKIGSDDDRIFLVTKGADNVIFERLVPGDEDTKAATEDHLSEFAGNGLRTLTLAYRVVPAKEYEDWNKRYNEASLALDNREELVDAISAELERDLRLLGATAIEDRLQDGVPETIADLKEAGIKIWVATGDKLETAIAIGHSTNLIGREDNIIIIRGGSGRAVYSQMLGAVEEFFPASGILGEELVRDNIQSAENPGGMYDLQRVNTGVTSIVGSNNGHRLGGFVLVIDGAALGDALGDEAHKHLLLRLAMQCEGVICCRVSPLQKALVVKLVKDGLGTMTLAIGDGANDVSMIQAADVGVGISGEEGLQAVNSSDYAIAQFRFLKRLLLVHGHWSYARNGNMIVNFFYKNFICIGVLWWFQIYCAWSSAYAFEYTYLLFWNSFWTIAPVIAMGLFDRIADDHVLMALPELYSHSRRGEYFGIRLFSWYMFDGLYQSVIIFFFLLYTYVTISSRTDGYAVYQFEFSTTMAVAAVMTATLFNGMNTSTWTGWVFFALGIEIVLIWAYTAIYSAITPGWFATPVYGNDHYLFTSAFYWLGMLLVVPLALLPRFVSKSYKFMTNPSDIDRVRYIHKIDPDRDFSLDRKRGGLAHLRHTTSTSVRAKKRRSFFSGSRTDMATGLRSVHHGFDFDMEESGVALKRLQSTLSERQVQKKERRKKTGSKVLPSFSLPRSIRRKKTPSEPLPEEDTLQ
ncbi:Phospholipid-transporting ATPase [Abortiporus biennis]